MPERPPLPGRTITESKQKTSKGQTRRGFFTTGLAASALIGGAALTPSVLELFKEESVLEAIRNRRKRLPLPAPTINPKAHEQTIDLTAQGLEHIPYGKVSGYLGLSKKTGTELTVSFPEVMRENLWKRKTQYVEKKEPARKEVMSLFAKEFAKEYDAFYESNQLDLSTIEDEIKNTSAVARTTWENLRWEKDNTTKDLSIQGVYNLSDEDLTLVKDLMKRVSGKALMAYSLTEITPKNSHAEISVQEYDLLLKTAGKRFLARIPSLHDALLSFGQYQFTEHAIGEGRGASLPNKALPEEYQIAPTLSELGEYDEQTRAAYLFALHNFVAFVKGSLPKLEKKNPELRTALLSLTEEELAQCIGAMHHRPRNAHRAMDALLLDRVVVAEEKDAAEGKDNVLEPKKLETFFNPIRDKGLAQYVATTRRNYEALGDVSP